jgi:multimeric flavodoxin WrbA
MKFCVINGSPKGKYSVTLQSIRYLEKKFEEHTFDVYNVGQQIKAIEKDMSKVVTGMKEADAIIFAYPVYTFIAPSQIHRFIELIKENNIDLSGKYVTQITTSKHFYDVTAHKYIEENAYDLNMKFIKGLSADMEDLLNKAGQEDLEKFFNYFVNSISNDIYEPIIKKDIKVLNYNKSLEVNPKKENHKAVIVADLLPDDYNLKNMIDDFINTFPYEVSVVNIREYPFSGGCLGCFNCAADGKCIYKDNFDSFLRDNIQTADAIIIAFTIKDHSMGARFKLYDDRQFCNGHRTVTEGMPFGYIINGDYESEFNLKTIVEARAEVGGNFLAGVGYDEKTLKMMASKLEYAMENKYVLPRNFYGVGGMKIFRDLIWIMRGIMKADHVYYKKHGVYDFPQKKRGQMMLMCLLGSMVRNKKIKAKMGNKFNEGMVAPYKKVIDKLDKK